jgi:CheY-like chemotaxis protein
METMPDGFKTVLVVDDEKGVREIVAEIISDLGYTVWGVGSGEAALNLITETPVDLIISDVKMNGMDGLSLAKKVRAKFPKLPLALMTSYPSDEVHRLLREKMVDFLLMKPFKLEELQGMVQRLAG